ncbi:MAG TPA: helix-turn-helix domain-containing protein [Actinomycetota bacterium]
MVESRIPTRRRALVERLYAGGHGVRPAWLGETLLRTGQVAALFQVSRRTVSEWARAGKLESIVTPGGHRRYPASHVRALLESQHTDVPS